MTTTLRLFAVSLLMLVLVCTTLIGNGCERMMHADSSSVEASSYDKAWSDVDELVAYTAGGSSLMCMASVHAAVDLSQPGEDFDKELMTWSGAGDVVLHLAPQWFRADLWLAPLSSHASGLLRPPRA